MSDKIKERVDRGIQWLDLTKPDWRDRVSIDSFSMAFDCILCQVFNTYQGCLNLMGEKRLIHLGLFASKDDLEEGCAALNKEWKKRLTKLYSLNIHKVNPGTYIIHNINATSTVFDEDDLVEVVDFMYLESGGMLKGSEQIINMVVHQGQIYINPPIEVAHV